MGCGGAIEERVRILVLPTRRRVPLIENGHGCVFLQLRYSLFRDTVLGVVSDEDRVGKSYLCEAGLNGFYQQVGAVPGWDTNADGVTGHQVLLLMSMRTIQPDSLTSVSRIPISKGCSRPPLKHSASAPFAWRAGKQ